jgi:hypothetical protein
MLSRRSQARRRTRIITRISSTSAPSPLRPQLQRRRLALLLAVGREGPAVVVILVVRDLCANELVDELINEDDNDNKCGRETDLRVRPRRASSQLIHTRATRVSVLLAIKVQ